LREQKVMADLKQLVKQATGEDPGNE